MNDRFWKRGLSRQTNACQWHILDQLMQDMEWHSHEENSVGMQNFILIIILFSKYMNYWNYNTYQNMVKWNVIEFR